MKGRGTGGGKNDTSSEVFSTEWGNFDFYGCLDCWK